MHMNRFGFSQLLSREHSRVALPNDPSGQSTVATWLNLVLGHQMPSAYLFGQESYTTVEYTEKSIELLKQTAWVNQHVSGYSSVISGSVVGLETGLGLKIGLMATVCGSRSLSALIWSQTNGILKNRWSRKFRSRTSLL